MLLVMLSKVYQKLRFIAPLTENKIKIAKSSLNNSVTKLLSINDLKSHLYNEELIYSIANFP